MEKNPEIKMKEHKTIKMDLNQETFKNDKLRKYLISEEQNDVISSGKQSEYDEIMNTPIQSHQLEFDETVFKDLLAESDIFALDEKIALMKMIPTLNQFQIEEIIKTLQEAKRKFIQLEKRYNKKLE